MNIVLAVLGLLVGLAVLSTRTARRWGVPSLVLFVALGMLAGSEGPGGVAFEGYQLAYDVGNVALAVILFSGGLSTPLSTLRRSMVPALALSTVGVVVKLLVMALLAMGLAGLDLASALMLGAVLAPTDAAAVFSVLRGAGLPERLEGVLETESGTNDPMAVYLTIALATALTGGSLSVGGLLSGVVAQLGLGLVAGLAFGRGTAWLLGRVDLEGSGLYPVLAIGAAMLTFSLTNLVGGNGFLAVYVTGLLLADRRVSHLHEIRTSFDALAWAAQIGMFLLLGLLSSPDRLLGNLGAGALLAAAMILVARPLSVLIAVRGFAVGLLRYPAFDRRELALLSWAGLKGAVPIILATVPLLHGVPQGELVFDLVFVVVIVGTLIQGTTTVPLARWLGLLQPGPPEPPITVALAGAAPPGAHLESVWLGPRVPAVGRTLAELDLPHGMIVSAVVREGSLIAPSGALRLAEGDHLFVLSVEGAAIPAVFTGRTEPTTNEPPAPTGPPLGSLPQGTLS